MSYIPKYIIKRMVPKDSIKRVDNGLEMHLINVISPITIDEIPDDFLNYLNYLEVNIDGKPVSSEVKKGIKIIHEGETYDKDNLKDAIGKTIPVGGELTFFIPETSVNSGEEHEIDVLVKLDNPIEIKVKRTIQ